MRRIRTLLLDLVLIALATFLALFLRDNMELSPFRLWALMPYLLYSVLAAAIILPASGMTSTLWRFSGMYDYWRLVVACALIVLSAVAITFAFSRMDNVSRSVPILQFLLMATLLLGLRGAMRAHRFRHGRPLTAPVDGGSQETVLVVGLNSVAELFLQATAEHAAGRIYIAGVLGRNDRQTGQKFRSYPILGVPEEVSGVLKELEVHGVYVDRIVVAISFEQLSPLARQALMDVENGSQIRVDFFAERIGFTEQQAAVAETRPRAGANDKSELTLLDPQDAVALREALRRPYWKVKRLLDVMLGSLAFLAALPVMVVVGLCVAITHGMPVLFWQQRPGRNGHPFKVYKFRSLLGAHDAAGRRLTDEERSTFFGRLLRASRFDELPQLVNVINGCMSIVGPRPLLDADQIEAFRDRLRVRPGLTGWAQVNGGKMVSASDKMALDMWYIRNASFRLDCKIIWLTLKMVLQGERQNPVAVEQAWMELGSNKRRPGNLGAEEPTLVSGLR